MKIKKPYDGRESLNNDKMRTKAVSNPKKKNNEKIGKSETTSFVDGLKSYLKGVKSEWHKITWPERKQVVVEVIVVLGVVFFFTVMVYLFDITFRWLLGLIPNR